MQTAHDIRNVKFSIGGVEFRGFADDEFVATTENAMAGKTRFAESQFAAARGFGKTGIVMREFRRALPLRARGWKWPR